jgi:GGDEF domain-containing protein
MNANVSFVEKPADWRDREISEFHTRFAEAEDTLALLRIGAVDPATLLQHADAALYAAKAAGERTLRYFKNAD